MTEKEIKTLRRCKTSGSISINNDIKSLASEGKTKIKKAVSFDSSEKAEVTKSISHSTGNLHRRAVTTIRRRTSKRKGKLEPEFGHDTETYEKIRERILRERAVTNAIDALQERWKMIMLMYEDCVDLNNRRVDRKLRKLCVQRQFEMVIIAGIFILICIPILVAFTSFISYLK